VAFSRLKSEKERTDPMTKAKRHTVDEDVRIQDFLDMIAPSVVKFNADHFICGNTYRCVWALREYPTATDEQAILRHLGEKDGITLKIYTRHVTPVEERKIISNAANKNRMKPADYPILSDLYALIEDEYKAYDGDKRQLYTAELLQEILLGLHSLCKGAESKFFDGHTNISSSQTALRSFPAKAEKLACSVAPPLPTSPADLRGPQCRFVTFGVKGLLQASKNIKNALLFNVLSYMSNELLTKGSTVASIDELYLFLTNLTAIEYIRNFMKRVRKKNSAVILASQNLEDCAKRYA